MESILTSVKKMLGIAEDYTHFDPDIIMHINSVFMILTQLGIGPENGFYIEDDLATWDEFIPNGQNIEAVRTYIGLKVRTIFDPPASSTILNSMEKQIAELEWRLNSMVDYK